MMGVMHEDVKIEGLEDGMGEQDDRSEGNALRSFLLQRPLNGVERMGFEVEVKGKLEQNNSRCCCARVINKIDDIC